MLLQTFTMNTALHQCELHIHTVSLHENLEERMLWNTVQEYLEEMTYCWKSGYFSKPRETPDIFNCMYYREHQNHSQKSLLITAKDCQSSFSCMWLYESKLMPSWNDVLLVHYVLLKRLPAAEAWALQDLWPCGIWQQNINSTSFKFWFVSLSLSHHRTNMFQHMFNHTATGSWFVRLLLTGKAHKPWFLADSQTWR